MGRSVTVAVPATSANMGPGFDSVGIALDLTGSVTVRLLDAPAPPPANRASQMAYTAAGAVYARVGLQVPTVLQASYEGDLPVGRGLGASAVLRVGAIVAANRLLDGRLQDDELLTLASTLEGHADNVAPAMFGGFQVVVWEDERVTRVEVPFPGGLKAIVLVPDLEMPTHESRLLLPSTLTRAQAVHNIGRAALLVGALATGRLDALRIASEDVLHQPSRGRIFSALFDIIGAALDAGAVCSYLSGGGSAVLALTADDPEAIGQAMLAAAARHSTAARYLVTSVRRCGAQVIDDRQTP